MFNEGFGSWIWHALATVISGIFSLFALLVSLALLVLVVRFLLVATRAAQLYIARNAAGKVSSFYTGAAGVRAEDAATSTTPAATGPAPFPTEASAASTAATTNAKATTAAKAKPATAKPATAKPTTKAVTTGKPAAKRTTPPAS